MNTITKGSTLHAPSDVGCVTADERLDAVREMLIDLRHSIQTQRHMINLSREMLERL